MDTLIDAMKRDSDYDTNPYDGYYNNETDDIEWLEYGDGQFESDEVLEEKKKFFESKKNQYILIPCLNHGEWHEVFKEFLQSIDKLDDYTTSIGLTLKQLGEDVKSWWQIYQYEYAEKMANDFIEKNSKHKTYKKQKVKKIQRRFK